MGRGAASRLRSALADVRAGGEPGVSVRPEILASWRRAALFGLDPDHVDLRHDPDPDAADRLLRIVTPVLAPLKGSLEGTGMGIVVADADARIIRRFAGSSGRRRRVGDSVCRPGFCFPEHRTGTNGIGTPIEIRRPLLVAGAEHYCASLTAFTCAGAPVQHPITGRIEGVVAITTPDPDPSPLMLPFVERLAAEIRERLLSDASADQRLLLASFLDVSRRSPYPVAAMSDEILVADRSATVLLEGIEQPLLWERVGEQLASRSHRGAAQIPLEPTGYEARCSPVEDGRRVVGAVLEFVKVTEAPGPVVPSTSSALPGLAGSGPAWRRLCGEILRLAASSRNVVTVGEPGTGKLSVLEAGFGADANEELVVVDCAGIDAARSLSRLLGGVGPRHTIVLRHLEALDAGALARLFPILSASMTAGGTLLGTLTPAADRPLPAGALVDHFGCVEVRVPPLRARPEDIGPLVRHVVAELGSNGRVTIGSDVLQLFLRLPWPDNVRELRSVVRSAVAVRAAGQVTVSDLPPELLRGATRRPLSPIDQATYDTLLEALRVTQGNKLLAAKRLGISRSTLYRLLKAHGLDLERSFF